MSSLGMFSAAEVYDMAIRTEQNGRAFYEAAAAAARTPEVRKLMVALGKAEGNHEETFRALKSGSQAKPLKETYKGERNEYVDALLLSRVLPDPETGVAAVSKMTSDAEALDFALLFEKDTILFMYEMQDVVPDEEKARIDVLINQEKEHVKLPTEMKNSLA